ncbi:MAG TPA: ABC transporter ATP-binding protein [Anaerolineae bacterium]
MKTLSLQDIKKSFDGVPVLRDVSMDIAAGETVVLLGPSGGGKTTLLRIIAGLEQPDSGKLLLNGRDLAQVPIHQRGFGMVFQDYALFPHKNVFENIAFGLRMLNWQRPRVEARVNEILTLVGLADFGPRPIFELSGGEQQRVALARALAPAPRLVLLDEPLGSLDQTLRDRLMGELRAILKQAGGLLEGKEGMTAVYVTHDQAEAFAIADRVVVVHEGRVEQAGPPRELYRRPATPFVARFLGMENVFEGEVIATEPLIVRTTLGDLTVGDERLEKGTFDFPFEDSGLRQGKDWGLESKRRGHRVTLLIRPEAAQLLDGQSDSAENVCQGCLQSLSFRGRYQVATIEIPNLESSASNLESPIYLKLEFDSSVSLPPAGSTITFALKAKAILLLESG